MVILCYRAGELIKKTVKETNEDNVLGMAAQAAYNFFFSLFPLLLFIAPMLSLLGDKQKVVSDLLSRLSEVVPPDALSLLSKVINDVVFAKNAPGLISIGALLAAWSGSNIFTTFMEGLNTAYDVKDVRPWWKKRLLALAVLLGWAIIITLVTAILLAGDIIVLYAQTQLGMEGVAVKAWAILQFPLAIALLIAFLYLMYWLLPHVKQNKRQILAGSVLAACLFVIATLLFRLYVQHFPTNKTYGTVGAVMVLLSWMYVVSVVILVGGELNSELHQGTGFLASTRGGAYTSLIATGKEPFQPSSKLE